MKRNTGTEENNSILKEGQRRIRPDKLDYISVNDLLQVYAADDPDPSGYRSRVNDIAGGRIIIAHPTRRGIRLPARVGQKLEFTLLHNDIPYAFIGVVKKTVQNPLPQLTIAPVGPVLETQRRSDFRLKCFVQVEITGSLDPPQSHDEFRRNTTIKTATYDMSAGGFSIRHSRNIPEGTFLEANLKLPDKGPRMKIPCRVVFSAPAVDNPSMHHIGTEFLTITNGEQARIFRYLQRLQLQRVRG